MKTLIALILSTIIFALGMSPANADHNGEIYGTFGSTPTNCGTYWHGAEHKSVFMVGDSITAGAKSELLDLKPNWEINALGGRTVDCLYELVRQRLQDGYMGKLVIALGTNAIEGWEAAQYQEVVDMARAQLPNLVVVFVSTYRDRDIWNEENGYKYRGLASTQYWITKWMYQVRDTHVNNCSAPWREKVMNNEHWLSDGVHPTPGEGRRKFARIVSDAVGSCWAS